MQTFLCERSLKNLKLFKVRGGGVWDLIKISLNLSYNLECRGSGTVLRNLKSLLCWNLVMARSWWNVYCRIWPYFSMDDWITPKFGQNLHLLFGGSYICYGKYSKQNMRKTFCACTISHVVWIAPPPTNLMFISNHL